MSNLVSICIPTYNGEQFIVEAMDSAISQTYPYLEIIVSDDDSKDNTLKIIESYRAKTNIPIHVFHHVPSGIGANWNHSIKKANGKYIKFLFQDDILKPDCVKKMVEVLERNNYISLVASKREFIFKNSYLNDEIEKWIKDYNDLQSGLNLDWSNGVAYLDYNLFSSEEFFKTPLNKIGEPTTILFKKSLVDSIGYFSEDLNQVLDYEFCYRVLKHSRIAIIKDKLIKFRLHNLQATVKNKGNDIYGKDHDKLQYIIYKNYLKYLSSYWRKVLLRKYNPLVSMFYNFIDIFKRYLPNTNR